MQAFRLKPLVDRNELSPQLIIQIASPSPLAGVVTVRGMLAAFSWIVWRFGPALLRIAGFCSLWVAWACGSQGGYDYGEAFLVLGTLAWGGGTVWYARRRGRWPSALSAKLFTRLLGSRNPLMHVEPPRSSALHDASASRPRLKLRPPLLGKRAPAPGRKQA